MDLNFLDQVTTSLYQEKPMPGRLGKFLLALDDDIKVSDGSGLYNLWTSEELDGKNSIGLKAHLLLNSSDFKDTFKDYPVFNNNVFTINISVGKFTREVLYNLDTKNQNLSDFYKKHQSIIFTVLGLFPKTNKLITELGVENFELLNFTLKQTSASQSGSSGYGGDYGGSYGGDYGSQYGDSSSPKEIIMSATMHSPILETDIEIYIKTGI